MTVPATTTTPPVTTAPPAGAPPVTDPPGNSQDDLRADLDRERNLRIAAEKTAKEKADALEVIRMNGLKEKDDWKKVAQDFEEKYNTERATNANKDKIIVTDKKMTAIKDAALKAGLLESASDDLELVDFKEVTVETTSTGRINVLGVDRAVQSLKAKKPHWFGKATPNVNGNAPGVGSPSGGSKISEADVLKAEDEARKTGDWSKVQALHKQYREQN